VVRVKRLKLILYKVLTKVRKVKWLRLKEFELKINYNIKVSITLKSALLDSKPGRKLKFC